MSEIFSARDTSFAAFNTSKSTKRFSIPDFQRKFVWGKDEFSDLIQSMYVSPKGYFIGTLVYSPSDQDQGHIDIIDGQQRLTCIFITLSVLGNMLSSLDDSGLSAEQQQDLLDYQGDVRNWLKIKNTKTGKRISRLHFVEASDYTNELFEALIVKGNGDLAYFHEVLDKILSKAKDEKEKVIRQSVAYKFINAYQDIEKILNNLEINNITEISKFIEKIHELQLIDFECKKYELVHTLFEGLNSKGIKLTRSEQIKNVLYGHIVTYKFTNKEKLKELWQDIELTFDSAPGQPKDLLDKFLRHYWIVNHEFIYMSKLFPKFKDKIRAISNEAELEKLLLDLRSNALFYLACRTGDVNAKQFRDVTTDNVLCSQINEFSKLNNDQVYLLLLLFGKLMRDTDITTKNYKLWLKNIWTVTFRLKFVSTSPSDFEGEITKYIRRIQKLDFKTEESTIVNQTKIFVDNLWPLVDNSEQFTEKLIENLQYKEGNIALITKVLSDLLNAEKRSIIVKNPEIEHILPKQPVKWGFERAQIKEVLNRIGNLTLLNELDNKDVGNETFTEKVKINFEKSDFQFNQDISKYSGFSSKDLNEVTKEIERRSVDVTNKIDQLYVLQQK